MRPKSKIYTPKRDDEHPRLFHMGVPPPGVEANGQDILKELCHEIHQNSNSGNWYQTEWDKKRRLRRSWSVPWLFLGPCVRRTGGLSAHSSTTLLLNSLCFYFRPSMGGTRNSSSTTSPHQGDAEGRRLQLRYHPARVSHHLQLKLFGPEGW